MANTRSPIPALSACHQGGSQVDQKDLQQGFNECLKQLDELQKNTKTKAGSLITRANDLIVAVKAFENTTTYETDAIAKAISLLFNKLWESMGLDARPSSTTEATSGRATVQVPSRDSAIQTPNTMLPTTDDSAEQSNITYANAHRNLSQHLQVTQDTTAAEDGRADELYPTPKHAFHEDSNQSQNNRSRCSSLSALCLFDTTFSAASNDVDLQVETPTSSTEADQNVNAKTTVEREPNPKPYNGRFRSTQPVPKAKGKDKSGGRNTVTPSRKQKPPMRRAPRQAGVWTEEEDQIAGITIWETAQKMTKKEAWDAAAKSLRKKGYDRTPGTCAFRWYTKLKARYEDENQTQANDEAAQSEPIQPDKPETTEIVQTPKEGKRKPITKLLMHSRLGSRANLRCMTTSSRNLLKEESGKHFVIARTWTGASNDVLEVCWAPNGLNYVAANAAQEGEYNRPNNLLLGSTAANKLRPLHEHRTRRMDLTSNLLDEWNYSTVTGAQWFGEGNGFVTAAYDNTVKTWEMSQSDNSATCTATWEHPGPVIVMNLSTPPLGLVATGTRGDEDSLRVYAASSQGSDYSVVPLSRPHRRTFDDSPTCLKFGIATCNQEYLLGGFGSEKVSATGQPSSAGYLGLWKLAAERISQVNVSPRSKQVFDVAWSLRDDTFLTANSAKKGQSGTIIRIYSASQEKVLLETTCPAFDINEVGFCPFNERIVSACATNGITYLWDLRRLDKSLHKLCHGPNTSPYARRDGEIYDTGVRLLQWGRSIAELYTGSSDGVLKLWDVRRNSSDAIVENVLETGVEIMSGMLSPDQGDFLVGDAAGSLHILSRSSSRIYEQPESIQWVDETFGDVPESEHVGENVEGDEGRVAARELIQSGQIRMHPEFGPVQGPNYQSRAPGKLAQKDRVPEIERTKKLIVLARKRSLEDPSSPAKRIKLRKGDALASNKAFSDSYLDSNNHLGRMSSMSSIQERGGRRPTAATSELITGLEPGGNQQHETDVGEEHSSDTEGSDHWFPPHSLVDANIWQYRAET